MKAKKAKTKKQTSASSRIRTTSGTEPEVSDEGSSEEGSGTEPSRPKLTDEEYQATAERLFGRKDKIDLKIAEHHKALAELDEQMSEVAKEVLEQLGGVQLGWRGSVFTANHRLQKNPDGTTRDRYHFRGQYAEVRQIG